MFQAAHQGKELLLFSTVENVVRQSFPKASFQATLNACTRRLPTPVIYLEATLGHKAVVKREIEYDSPGLFAFEELPAELRAVRGDEGGRDGKRGAQALARKMKSVNY
jgi:hypothetical protein